MKKLSAFLVIVLGIFLSACTKNNSSSFFLYDDELVCEVVQDQSSDNIGGSYKGKTIAITGLLGNEQKVIYPEGNSSPMKKISETNETVTIQLVASGSGSTDTFQISKENGQFTETGQGNIGGPYSFTRSGTCK